MPNEQRVHQDKAAKSTIKLLQGASGIVQSGRPRRIRLLIPQKIVLIAKTHPLKHLVGTKFLGKTTGFLGHGQNDLGLVLIETGYIKPHGDTSPTFV